MAISKWFWRSLIGIELAEWLEIGLLITALVGAAIAYNTWTGELEKRRLENTLKYTEVLTQKEFIDDSYDLEEFTVCFEQKNNIHLSYRLYTEVVGASMEAIFTELATKWWGLIEMKQEMQDCNLSKDMERKLGRVYAKIATLASCLESGVCSYDKFAQFSSAADLAGVVAITNYIRLSAKEGVSTEWSVKDGYVISFLGRLEEEYKDFMMAKREKMWTSKRQLKQ